MKHILFFALIFINFHIVVGQSLPIDFESDITTDNFEDFDGGVASVIDNPSPTGINTSNTVAKIVRDGGAIWSGSKIKLASNLDFTSNNKLSMKVFTSAPVGTVVKFKLEGNGETERDMQTTVSNEWETLVWDFTGTPANFDDLVFMFDFGNVGDGSSNSTFYFDDVEQLFGGTQLDLPVDFEGMGIDYTMSDFGGNSSMLAADPNNSNNQVVEVLKTESAATWAGTTIGTPAGFASNIPLTLDNSVMSVRVWSPKAGTPIRLKVEDSDDPTHTCETETNTTLDGQWEYLEFDFNNQAPGTELLSIGLSMGWTYNMASIFFNFGTEGVITGPTTYYFDEVRFGSPISNIEKIDISYAKVFPNPTNESWMITTEQMNIESYQLFTIDGQLLLGENIESDQFVVDASNLPSGLYFAKLFYNNEVDLLRLVRN